MYIYTYSEQEKCILYGSTEEKFWNLKGKY